MGKILIYGTDGVLLDFDPLDAAGSIPFTGDQSLGGKKLTSLGAPTTDGDALSKGDAVLVGTEVAVVADANVIGGIPIIHRLAIAAGAKGNHDITLTHKERVIDAWIVSTADNSGVTGATVTIKNIANAITNAMSGVGADKAIVRAGEIDVAYHEIAAAGKLRVTTDATGANGGAYQVYVLCLRVA